MCAELSYFWSDNGIGDASESPYSDYEFVSQVFRFVLQYDRETMGPIDTGDPAYTGGLIVNTGAGQVTVQTGVALVDGTFYKNSAAVNVAIPTPAASTRVDRIVLRKDFGAQTVRVTRIAGVEGGGAPSVTQTDGVTWDVKLATVSITTAGAITVTQEAVAVRTPLGPGYKFALAAGNITGLAAGAFGDINVSFTVGPGTWLIWGTLEFTPVTATGDRQVKILDNTGGGPISINRRGIETNELTQRQVVACAPQIVDFAVTSQVKMQFYPGHVNDTVIGSGASIAITSMIGIRVV